MASSRVYFYEVIANEVDFLSDCVDKINNFNDDFNYFEIENIDEKEIYGKFIVLKNVAVTHFDVEKRAFERRTEVRASIVYFNIFDNIIEVWGNKATTDRLIFILCDLLNNVSINLVELSLEKIICKLQSEKVVINKVNFKDFIFEKDIIGNFSVDLSSYGDAFGVINKYKSNISKLTITILYNNEPIKISITSNSSVIVYEERENIEDETLTMLRNLLLKEIGL